MARTKTGKVAAGRRALSKVPDEDPDATDSSEDNGDEEEAEEQTVDWLSYLVAGTIESVKKSKVGEATEPDDINEFVDYTNSTALEAFTNPKIHVWTKTTGKKVASKEFGKLLGVKSGKEPGQLTRIQMALIIRELNKNNLRACLVEQKNQRRHDKHMELLTILCNTLGQDEPVGGRGKPIKGTRRSEAKSEPGVGPPTISPWATSSARYNWSIEIVRLLNSPRYDDEDYFIDDNTMRLRLLGNDEGMAHDPHGYKKKVIAAMQDDAHNRGLWVSPANPIRWFSTPQHTTGSASSHILVGVFPVNP